MSFGISSRVYPSESLVAILAIGNPVALDASAEERENAWVHFDNNDAPGLGVYGKLNIASAGIKPQLRGSR